MDGQAINLQDNKESVIKSGVKRLTLTDFRNYASLRLNAELCPIVITGENGSGKTNILEAISFLTPGRGLRSAKLADIKRISPSLVANDYIPAPNGWAVSAVIANNFNEIELGTGIETATKEVDDDTRFYERRIVKINGQKTSSQADLGRYISAIWLTPQMDRLFKGGSQPRRSFLDRLVYAFDLEHAKRTANFEHLYKEWFQLIKSGKTDGHWLSSIEQEMAAIGVAIAAARREQTARLNTFIENEPDDVFPNVKLALEGTIEQMLDERPAIEVEDYYLTLLQKQRQNVLYSEYIDGINRTDFKVFYKKKRMPAELCSTGEQKSLLVSIILAQTKCQTLDKGFSPVLLLDEVAAHLDDAKREALLSKIKDLHVQAWVTSTTAELFTSMRDDAQFFEIKNNHVFER